MTVKYITNPRRKHSRFAVVISKKVLKSAVRRNRVRRRVYEVIRGELPMLKDNHDVALIIFTADFLHMEYTAIQNEIKRLFSQANLYK